MTTIAYRDGVMCADRCVNSGGTGHCQARKVYEIDGWLFAAAGAAAEASIIAGLIRSKLTGGVGKTLEGFLGKTGYAEEESRQTGILVNPSGAIHFLDRDKDGNIFSYQVDALFAASGSGRDVALGAMAAGKSAEEAVEIASQFDLGTGSTRDLIFLRQQAEPPPPSGKEGDAEDEALFVHQPSPPDGQVSASERDKTPGEKIIEGARHALAIARGEDQPARVHFVEVAPQPPPQEQVVGALDRALRTANDLAEMVGLPRRILRELVPEGMLLQMGGDGRWYADVDGKWHIIVESASDEMPTAFDPPPPLAPGDGHASDCATHNEPAFPNGPCNCGASSTPRHLIVDPASDRPLPEPDDTPSYSEAHEEVEEKIDV